MLLFLRPAPHPSSVLAAFPAFIKTQPWRWEGTGTGLETKVVNQGIGTCGVDIRPRSCRRSWSRERGGLSLGMEQGARMPEASGFRVHVDYCPKWKVSDKAGTQWIKKYVQLVEWQAFLIHINGAMTLPHRALTLTVTIFGRYHFHPHFTHEKVETQKV